MSGGHFVESLFILLFFAGLTINREPKVLNPIHANHQLPSTSLEETFENYLLTLRFAVMQGREIAICREWFSVAKLCTMETEQI